LPEVRSAPGWEQALRARQVEVQALLTRALVRLPLALARPLGELRALQE
jgi:hypothetical protein